MQLPLYVVGSRDGREYCNCDDCGKTSWRDALEKAQYVRRVSPAMILGLEPVPEGMVAYIVGLGSKCYVEFVEAEKLGVVDVEGSSGSGSPWIKTESSTEMEVEGGSSESGGSLECVGRCRCGKGLCGPKGRKASRSRRCIGKELAEEIHPQALRLSGADIAKRQACYGGSSGLGMHSLSIGSHRNRVREKKDC